MIEMFERGCILALILMLLALAGIWCWAKWYILKKREIREEQCHIEGCDIRDWPIGQ
jgi:hypothetical protein